jgi:pimeloyl-ACP methyl ester carboxylesterase
VQTLNLRQHCGVPLDSPTLDVEGVRIAYTREGSGPPVVCLHAIGHGSGDYAAFSKALRDQYEVIRIDWPGHGRSGTDPQPPSAERYAQLLSGLLDQLRLGTPILMGNSIGGAAALLAASRRPVRALVLCDSGGLVPVNPLVRGITRVFRAFFGAGARGVFGFGLAYRLYYRWLILPAPAAALQRARIVAAGTEHAALLRDAWASFGQPSADLRATAAALDLPVWCAWSRRDRVIPLWMCRPAIRALRNGRLSVFDGGHTAFLEQPEAFVDGFRQFTAALAASPDSHLRAAPPSRP